MGFDKVKVKQICLVALYIAALGLALIYSKVLFSGIKMFLGILLPFIIGGVIAFVLNIPMKGCYRSCWRFYREVVVIEAVE